jgi:hypothetical protein
MRHHQAGPHGPACFCCPTAGLHGRSHRPSFASALRSSKVAEPAANPIAPVPNPLAGEANQKLSDQPTWRFSE